MTALVYLGISNFCRFRCAKQRGCFLLPDSQPYLAGVGYATSETSKCGQSSGAGLAIHFKGLGYPGIFVTDHFLNGNTNVPENLPWPDRVELFCHGYNLAAQKGHEIGLDVFLGW